jgi:hypothetical protein
MSARQRKPLAIDLFCGLGGWTEGLLAEGYDVIGFDIEQHVYGEHRYPGLLAIQDVLTLHGSQFRNADLIVASPPCQEYSYMAMPWSKAKAIAAEYRSGERDVKQLTALFDACFRIQREACEAAGRHIPLIVENVKGAQPWVGRARWNFGSFYLWGDIPALMPPVNRRGGIKAPGMNWSDQTKRGQDFTRLAGRHAMDGRKNSGGSWFNVGSPGQIDVGRNPVHELAGIKVPSGGDRRTAKGKGARFTSRDCGVDGVKHHGSGAAWFDTGPAALSSKSSARKAASAMIAKIPLPLSRHIAATFRPQASAEAAA